MPGLKPSQIPDLITTTLPHFKDRGRFGVVFELQQYYYLDTVFAEDKYEVQEGTHVEFRLVLDDNGTARHTNLYSNNEYDKRSVVTKGSATWCYAEAIILYEKRELGMNKGDAAIAKYIQTQYFAGYKSLANLIERRAVLPPNDATDDINPQGVSFLLSMTPASTVDYIGGFNGKDARYGDGTTTTTICGIDAANEWLWRNWCANHEGEVNMRTVRSMRRAQINTGFKKPRNIKEMTSGPTSKYRIFWKFDFQEQYENLVNSGSDNRNNDISPFKDTCTFRGVPTIGLPTYENLAYNPIHQVNFAHFMPIVKSGEWLADDEPFRHPNQRHTFVQGVDCTYNYMIDNRRDGHWVLNEEIP
jgi:hypothetical protein